jgi:hypothetical protein
MKLMGSEAPTRAMAPGNRPHRPAIAADRPTFSLALTVPIEWEPLSGPPTADMLARLERSNGGVLTTLLKCADLGTPLIEDDALADALQPLRVKIDMIVDMLARISYRGLALPDPRPIELGLTRIRWSQPTPLPVDTWSLSKIYFHDIFREPIALAGRIASCEREIPDGISRIEVDLAEMSEGLSESFARLVFLEHRRQLKHHAAHHPTQRKSP